MILIFSTFDVFPCALRSYINAALGICFGFIFASSVLAENSSRVDFALRYLDTIAAMDYDNLGTYYRAESEFKDPTAESFGETWHHKGPKSMVDFYRNANDTYKTIAIVYHYDKVYATGDYVVANYTAKVMSCAGAAGHPDKVFEGPINMVSVLKIRDGIVLQHIDYADYDGANAYFASIAEQLEHQAPDTRCIDIKTKNKK